MLAYGKDYASDFVVDYNYSMRAALWSDIDKWLKGIQNGTEKATMRAINHTGPVVKNAMIRATREKMKIKVKTLKGNFLFNRATIRDPHGNVIAEGPPIPAIYFRPKPSTNKRWLRGNKKRTNPPKVGVSIDLPKVGRNILPGTFIVERAKAWPRAGTDGPKYHVAERLGAYRFPIHIVHGVTVAEVLDKELEKLALAAQERLSARWHHEVGQLLDRGK